jgi:diaminopimelate decarboxylase
MAERAQPGFNFGSGKLSRHSSLQCDGITLKRIAEKHGTPVYVYSASLMRARYEIFDQAFATIPHTLCYSVKANSNLSLLRMLTGAGSGFDVVSGGELQRVLRAQKGAGAKVVFSGVGKTIDEMDAAVRADILLFNVESESELDALAARAAKLRKTARVALRVNPDVPAETHPYTSTGLHKHKFGVPVETARRLYKRASKDNWLDVAGVSAHIGSQITDVKPFQAAVARLVELVTDLRRAGMNIRFLDAGGGLGIVYEHAPEQPTEPLDEFALRIHAYSEAVMTPLRDTELHLLLEPGRAIVGPAGVLLTRVLYVKQNNGKRFAVVDAAMNDLIRPSLYAAHHDIVPVERSRRTKSAHYDVVGPICETGDFFAREREMPEVHEGDLLAILDAGAYGMAIASNYNTRPRAAEVLVDGSKVRVIRKRETFEQLIANEM